MKKRFGIWTTLLIVWSCVLFWVMNPFSIMGMTNEQKLLMALKNTIINGTYSVTALISWADSDGTTNELELTGNINEAEKHLELKFPHINEPIAIYDEDANYINISTILEEEGMQIDKKSIEENLSFQGMLAELNGVERKRDKCIINKGTAYEIFTNANSYCLNIAQLELDQMLNNIGLNLPKEITSGISTVNLRFVVDNNMWVREIYLCIELNGKTITIEAFITPYLEGSVL